MGDKLAVEKFPLLNHKPALMRAYKASINTVKPDDWVEKEEFKTLLGNFSTSTSCSGSSSMRTRIRTDDSRCRSSGGASPSAGASCPKSRHVRSSVASIGMVAA